MSDAKSGELAPSAQTAKVFSFSTAEAIARIDLHVPFAELTREQTAAWAMFRALGNVPCTCQHNVPYAGMQTEQVITQQCGRCKAMAAWLELQPQERVTVSTAAAPGASA